MPKHCALRLAFQPQNFNPRTSPLRNRKLHIYPREVKSTRTASDIQQDSFNG